jgi:diacylglycerol kinase family enzyme
VTSLLITNAGAGSTDRERVESVVRILQAGGPVEVVEVEEETDLNRALDGRGDRRLLVAGGDGTLHRAVAALFRRGELAEAELGLIPMGTGNDFARAVRVPLDPDQAAALILNGTIQPVDLVVDDLGDISLNVVQVGVGAEASRRGAFWKERLGRLGYAVGLVQASASRAFSLQIEIDGESVAGPDRPVLEVSVGNGSTVGGGLPLNPGADPTDGKLDVLVSYATGPLRRISYAVDLVRAQQPGRHDVLRRSCDSVTVSGKPFFTSADGEIYGPVSRRQWRLERRALRMILARQRPSAPD